MGEMADYELENVMDDEDALLDYRTGVMSIEDAFNRGLIDELGRESIPWANTARRTPRR